MKKITSFFFKTHRVTCCIISIFLMMWFATGLVLVYHSYPRLDDGMVNSLKETIADTLPSIDEILEREDIPTPKQMSLRQFQGQTLLSVSAADGKRVVCTQDGKEPLPISSETYASVASRWIDAPVKRIDTLDRLQQWILYSRYEKELPIYKYVYDDSQEHELFISSRTAEVQQLTDRKSRIWSYFGAIPHKLYIPALRKNTETWELVLRICGILCFIGSLTGIIIGIYMLRNYRRKHGKYGTPYKKFWYKIHHIGGLAVSLIILAWSFSGIFAMNRVPKWIVPYEGGYFVPSSKIWGRNILPLSEYKLDYRKLKEVYPDLKEVTWTRFANVPAYVVIEGRNEHTIDASSDQVKPLFLSQNIVEDSFRRLLGDSTTFNIQEIDEYDNYYLSESGSLPLPAYKIDVDDKDGSLYYVAPQTGYVRFLNTNKKVRKWVFSAIHYLSIKGVVTNRTLWTTLMWLVCVLGATFSFTGVILSVKYVSRKTHRKNYFHNGHNESS